MDFLESKLDIKKYMGVEKPTKRLPCQVLMVCTVILANPKKRSKISRDLFPCVEKHTEPQHTHIHSRGTWLSLFSIVPED